MKTYKLKNLFLLLFLGTATAFAQTKKLDKTYKTNKDVQVNIDARHTSIVVETWDRNEVQVQGFLDTGSMNSAEAKKLLDNWKLETSGTAGEINISSGGVVGKAPEVDMAGLTESMGHLQEMLAPLMTEMVGPMMESFAKHPPLPPDFAEKMGNLNFDYEAYQRDGDKYMKKWEAHIEKNFGKDFEASMEKWAEQFEKNAEVWSKKMESEMEVSGEKFEQSMEQWAESFGAEMEKWGESIAREMEGKEHASRSNIITAKGVAKTNRQIKIKMPAGARLNLDVRHGEVNLGPRTTNLKANLSHSRLSGNIIDGEKTDVKASYTPIKIARWNYGVLNASYVQECVIDKAKSIKLVSNSSDVNIKEIEETGILSGTFGILKIGKIDGNFKNLDITLKNSDLTLSLPDTALNLNFNGSQSDISYPKAATVKSTTSYDNQMLNGYYKSGNSNRNISINASFSDVVIK